MEDNHASTNNDVIPKQSEELYWFTSFTVSCINRQDAWPKTLMSKPCTVENKPAAHLHTYNYNL